MSSSPSSPTTAAFVNLTIDCVLQCPAAHLLQHDRLQLGRCDPLQREALSAALARSQQGHAKAVNSGGLSDGPSTSDAATATTTASLYLWIYSAPQSAGDVEGSEAVAAVLKRIVQRGPSAFLTDTLTSSITACSVWTKVVCILRETAPVSATEEDAIKKLSRAPSASALVRRKSSAVMASMLYDRKGSLAHGGNFDRSRNHVRRFSGAAQLTAVPGRLARRAETLAVGLIAYHGPGNAVGNACFIPVIVNEAEDAYHGNPLMTGHVEGSMSPFGTELFVHRGLKLFPHTSRHHHHHRHNGKSLTPHGNDLGDVSFVSSVTSSTTGPSRSRKRSPGSGRSPNTPQRNSPLPSSVASVPMEYSKHFFLFRQLLVHRDHCDRLMEQFHVMVASSTDRHVCPTMVSQLHIPLELQGGMYSAKTQWFISSLADAMILSSMMRQHASNSNSSHDNHNNEHFDASASNGSGVPNGAATRRLSSALGAARSVADRSSKNSLSYYLAPGAVINALLRCCRSPKELLACRFRGDLDDALIIAELGSMNSGAHQKALAAPNAAAASSSPQAHRGASTFKDNPTPTTTRRQSSVVLPTGEISPPSKSNAGGSECDTAATGAVVQTENATHFAVEWYDFALLATAGHEAWEKVLLPLVDKYYTFPPLMTKVKQCANFRHSHMEQVREHILWVAQALKPAHMRDEDFQAFLDRAFPQWIPSSSGGGGGLGSRKSIIMQRAPSAGGTSGEKDRRAILAAASSASSITPPSWIRTFVKPSGRYAAKLGVLAPREWVEELHVTPCRLMWALLPSGLVNLVTDRTSRSGIFLSSQRRIARHTRMAQSFALSLSQAVLHSLLHRYLHRWLVFYRQRREFLRKRATLSAAMQRKAEGRLAGGYYSRWRQFAAGKQLSKLQQ